MKFTWSIVLLASIVLAVAGPIFFGHALVVHEKGFWFGLAAGCVAIAAGLFFLQKRYRTDGQPHH